MGKGEIARYEQFLLCQQCFQNACFPGASKGVIVWEWIKELNFVACIWVLNLVEKEENTGNQHVLLFPQCFLLFREKISHFSNSLQMLSIFVMSKILLFGKGLTLSQTSPGF